VSSGSRGEGGLGHGALTRLDSRALTSVLLDARFSARSSVAGRN
jgi:hypothetical protein